MPSARAEARKRKGHRPFPQNLAGIVPRNRNYTLAIAIRRARTAVLLDRLLLDFTNPKLHEKVAMATKAIEIRGLDQEFSHFVKWFDETWKSLQCMGRHNPLPQLLNVQAFNPWFVFWGLYRCCDPIRASSLPAARARLTLQVRHLHNCVSLSKKLDDELAQLEGATINRRLKMMLPDLSAELSIAPEDVSKIRAELMNLRKRFAANETRYSSIMNGSLRDRKKSRLHQSTDHLGH